MLTGTRHQRILVRLSEIGEASITELAALLDVSGDTIRRDLVKLDSEGLLQKTHGGAIALDLGAMPRISRNRLLPDVKTALGKAVGAAIPKGTTIMLDAGMTALAVARAIDVAVTVITHSLDVASVLAERTYIRLIVAGGMWDARQRLLKGVATAETIRRYRADLAILGACAIHVEHGVTANDEQDAEVKRAMLASSQAHWLVSDHLKFGGCEEHFVAGLQSFDHLYSDRLLLPAESAIVKQVLVPVPHSDSSTKNNSVSIVASESIA